MKSRASSTFNPDRPIESPAEDKLRRTAFTEQLAERISAWRGQESLVIGIYGAWGSGKSSVKNLVIQQLVTRNWASTNVIEFNPWLSSGDERITEAFFSEVGGRLEGLKDQKGAATRVAAWKKYSRALGVASKLASAFDLVAPALGALPGAGAWAHSRLKSAQELAEGAAAYVEKESASLQKLKAELRKHFRTLKAPLLVVIDDIDRLTSEEICLVFRLVKANADFPNTIYLLLFQRETAEKALNKISDGQGREFLEKIVQVGFDLPAISLADLRQVLFQGIEVILNPLVESKEWEAERWINIWMGGLLSFFSSIRDVHRFLNSFAFMVSAFECRGVLEVNPVDLLVIECLRVFEPGIYAILRESKSLLTKPHGNHGHAELEELAGRLLKAACCSPENTKEILRQLFPELGPVWQQGGFSHEFYRIWARRRRVCTPEFFERYFLLRLAPGQVSEATIREVLAVREDRRALQATLSKLEGEGQLLPALERLEAEDVFDKMADPLSYLLTLTDFSDRLPRLSGPFLNSSGSLLVRYAVNRVLGQTPDGNAREKIITKLVCDSQSIVLAADWIDDVENPKEGSAYPRIEGASLETLKRCWLERVRAAARTGKLLELGLLPWVLQFWMKWASPAEVRAWVASLLGDAKQTLAFLKAHINEATAQVVGSYHVQDKRWLPWKSLEPYHPRETWEKAEKQLLGLRKVSDDDERTRRLFQASMKRWRAGKTDDSPNHFEGPREEEDHQ